MVRVLALDDEEINLEIIDSYLSDEGIDVVQSLDGNHALEILSEDKDFSVILADKMMPKMSGIEFMAHIKNDDTLKNIPVIMQTAATDEKSIIEGISSGVYYYLTKPYKREMLVSIVNAAISDARYFSEISKEVLDAKKTIGLLENGEFTYKTVDEAMHLASFMANSFEDSGKVLLGLSEVMINAVEHGNLGIGFDLKGELIYKNKLHDEVEKRLKEPLNKDKSVFVKYYKADGEVVITVKDQGSGFDWNGFCKMDPARATRPNGRGIMMASSVSFDSIEYKEPGNEVVCRIKLDK